MGILLFVAILSVDGDQVDPEALLGDPDPDRRVRGVRRIAREDDLRAAKTLLRLHADPDARVRLKALEALSGITDREAREWLLERGLGHPEPTAREMAARALGRMGERNAVPGLRRLLEDRSESVRVAAVASIGRLRAVEAADEVSRRLRRGRGWRVRAESCWSLARISGVEALPQLLAALGDRAPGVRGIALEAIEGISPGEGRSRAIDHLDDADWSVRCTACRILGRVGGKGAVAPLIDALDEAEGRTKRDVMGTLTKITGRALGADVAAWRVWWEANGPSWTGPTSIPERDEGRSSRERATYYDIPIWSDRVVFVIDLSESMQEPASAGAGETRAERAREELGGALAGMPEKSRFNVVRFRSKAEVLSPRPLRPVRGNRAAALRWIDDPGGATNLHGALELAIRSGGGDTVFLLTDGAPSSGTFKNKTEILDSVRRMTRFRKVRIHAIGIGSRAVSNRWRGLLEGLAAATDGECVIRD